MEEARSQASKSARVSGYLRDIIWRYKFMSMESKVQIYISLNIQIKEMKVLRAIRSVTLRRTQRRDIRDELEVQDIVRWVRVKRCCSEEHVERMTAEGEKKTQHIPTPPGRLSKRWNESWTTGSQEVKGQPYYKRKNKYIICYIIYVASHRLELYLLYLNSNLET